MNYCSYTDGFFQILLKYSYLVTAVVITLSACLHGGGVPQIVEVTRLGGVTRHMLPHLPGVPYLHVNRPLL